MLKSKIAVVFIAALTIMGFFYYTQPFKKMSSDTADGAMKYNQNCLSCHGEKGFGDGSLALSLAKKPNNINKKFQTSWKPDNRLTRRILVGKPETGMPSFKGILTEKDAEDILSYIRTLN